MKRPRRSAPTWTGLPPDDEDREGARACDKVERGARREGSESDRFGNSAKAEATDATGRVEAATGPRAADRAKPHWGRPQVASQLDVYYI
jgi:hypothetical protein